LVLDPLVGGLTVASGILDDAIKAHGPLLDRFAANEVAA